jgi:peptide/nickel transport system permease protein
MSPEGIPGSRDQIAARRKELGLDDPLLVQFALWLRELASGNLGYSFHQELAVTGLIGDRLFATVLLASTGLGLALVVGFPLGILSAFKKNSWFDYGTATMSMLAISVPSFFTALIAIYIFSLRLDLFPSGGMASITAPNATILDGLRHLALPGMVLAAALVGPYIRFIRQGMLEVLRQDYMVTARAKGVGWLGVVVRHGMRNAFIPLITVLALQIPTLLTGVLIVEIVFSWPGLVRQAFDAFYRGGSGRAARRNTPGALTGTPAGGCAAVVMCAWHPTGCHGR